MRNRRPHTGSVRSRGRVLALAFGSLAIAIATPTVVALMPDPPKGQTQVPTTIQDFFAPGTQPNPESSEFMRVLPSNNCTFCHSDFSETFAPFDTWVSSMMAQSARDPIWHAARYHPLRATRPPFPGTAGEPT